MLNCRERSHKRFGRLHVRRRRRRRRRCGGALRRGDPLELVTLSGSVGRRMSCQASGAQEGRWIIYFVATLKTCYHHSSTRYSLPSILDRHLVVILHAFSLVTIRGHDSACSGTESLPRPSLAHPAPILCTFEPAQHRRPQPVCALHLCCILSNNGQRVIQDPSVSSYQEIPTTLDRSFASPSRRLYPIFAACPPLYPPVHIPYP